MHTARYLSLLVTLALFLFSVDKISLADAPELNTEGLVLSIESPKGNKGLILPRVSLEKLDDYLPVAGDPITGMLVENIADKGDIETGIYRWNGQSWAKILEPADMTSLDLGTKVYTGTADPDASQVEEVLNAPNGSLYIEEGRSIIYVKKQAGWEIVVRQNEENKYISGNGIMITPTSEGKEIQAKVGPGLKVSPSGISVDADETKLVLDTTGKLTANSDEALWNASKLNGYKLSDKMPSHAGELLVWNGSQWGPQGLDTKIDIGGNAVYLSGLSGSYAQSNEDRLLMVDGVGKIKLLEGVAWNMSGNSEILSGTSIIGFNRIDSEANLDIMTNGKSRLRFLSNGSIQMVTPPSEKIPEFGDGRLNIDSEGTIYQDKAPLWRTDGNNEILNGNKVIGITNKESRANIDIMTAGEVRLRFEPEGAIRVFNMTLRAFNEKLDNLVFITDAGYLYRAQSLPWWSKNQESVEIKTKNIKFANLPLDTNGLESEVVMIDPNGNLYRTKQVKSMAAVSVSGKSGAEKYREIKNKYLGTMREINSLGNSYKNFKIPLDLQKNSAGKIELYITSTPNNSGSLSRTKPVTVLLYYEYFDNFEPRITDAVILGGIRGSSVPSDIMDHSSDDIVDNATAAVFKTKDIERKPFRIGSMYITSADDKNGKYYLHFPIKGSDGPVNSDNGVRLSVELEAKLIGGLSSF